MRARRTAAVREVDGLFLGRLLPVTRHSVHDRSQPRLDRRFLKVTSVLRPAADFIMRDYKIDFPLAILHISAFVSASRCRNFWTESENLSMSLAEIPRRKAPLNGTTNVAK